MVLIEEANSKENLAAMGNRTAPCQEAFAKFLAGLFHWKLDTTDARTYSIKPDDYPRLPLYTHDANAADKGVLLNQVFWLMFDDALSWRSMSLLRVSCSTAEEAELLALSEYPPIEASPSGPALKAVPKISKQLVAYLEGLVAVSPYKDGPFDSRAHGVAEHAYSEALAELNKHKTEDFQKYLKRKLGDWYREAPKPVRLQGAAAPDGVDAAPAGEEEEEEGEGGAAGARAGARFSLDD